MLLLATRQEVTKKRARGHPETPWQPAAGTPWGADAPRECYCFSVCVSDAKNTRNSWGECSHKPRWNNVPFSVPWHGNIVGAEHHITVAARRHIICGRTAAATSPHTAGVHTGVPERANVLKIKQHLMPARFPLHFKFRIAFKIANTATPTSAKTAAQREANPSAPRASTSALTPRAKTMF